jgi:hypothetical protein
MIDFVFFLKRKVLRVSKEQAHHAVRAHCCDGRVALAAKAGLYKPCLSGSGRGKSLPGLQRLARSAGCNGRVQPAQRNARLDKQYRIVSMCVH